MLWNKELQPSADIYSQLSPLYQRYAPTLNRAYEDQATQIAILDDLGQMVVKSGHFRALESGWQVVNVSYSIDQYLLLLSTYSPYLKLEAQQRQNLFQGLRQILEGNGDTVALSYLSAFHIVQPC